MLYEILLFIFALITILMIFLVSIQKSQGGFFSGQGNNDSSIVFGGSGGMEIFQKITWILGILLMTGTLFLSIYKTKKSTKSAYNITKKQEYCQYMHIYIYIYIYNLHNNNNHVTN